ncbi:MAG: M20 family metallopeptidase [Planctomycetota bacterium]|nr:M20 family metallopeptidase [Planctomycetota bacterium]
MSTPPPPSAPRTCEELLAAMIGFDTVNSILSGKPDAERPLALWLESFAQSKDLRTQRLPVDGQSFNLLVTAAEIPGRPWLLLEAHLDTVRVDDMTIAPFAATTRDGKVFGRGACDVKGPGAAMLWALLDLARQPDRANNAGVLFVCDEEATKRGAIAFARRHLPALPWRPAGIVVGEPTMLRPIVAHNGVVRLVVHTRGVAAHSSNPALGRSAISMMLRVADAIESRYIPALSASHALTGRAQCSLNTIHGGTQVNIIPERCTIELDRRVVPGEDGRAVIAEIDAVLNAVRRANPGLVVTREESLVDPALDPRGSAPLIDHVRRALRAQGLSDEPGGAPFGTDASTYAETADAGPGIPSLVLGPGDIAQAHTCDEWISLDQLRLAVDVYGRILGTPWEFAP